MVVIDTVQEIVTVIIVSDEKCPNEVFANLGFVLEIGRLNGNWCLFLRSYLLCRPHFHVVQEPQLWIPPKHCIFEGRVGAEGIPRKV